MAVKFIVTHGYIQYGAQKGLTRGSECEICNVTERTDIVFDHCHAHGWIRGRVCQPCNLMLVMAETGTVIVPRQAGHLANCPDCPDASAWLAGTRPTPVKRTKCPAGCSRGILYLRSIGRFAPCPACKSREYAP